MKVEALERRTMLRGAPGGPAHRAHRKQSTQHPECDDNKINIPVSIQKNVFNGLCLDDSYTMVQW